MKSFKIIRFALVAILLAFSVGFDSDLQPNERDMFNEVVRYKAGGYIVAPIKVTKYLYTTVATVLVCAKASTSSPLQTYLTTIQDNRLTKTIKIVDGMLPVPGLKCEFE